MKHRMPVQVACAHAEVPIWRARHRSHGDVLCARSVRRAEVQISSSGGPAVERLALGRAVDVRWFRNAFEVVNTVIGERDPGSGDEVDDGPRYENLSGAGER
jgi:hypothetical protein